MIRRLLVMTAGWLAMFGLLASVFFLSPHPTTARPPGQTGGDMRLAADGPAVISRGDWSARTIDGAAYLVSADPAASLTVPFRGEGLSVAYKIGSAYGRFAIEVDSVILRTVNASAGGTGVSAVDYLAPGPHIARIYPVEGTVAIEAFIIAGWEIGEEPDPTPPDRERPAPRLIDPLDYTGDLQPTFVWEAGVNDNAWFVLGIEDNGGPVMSLMVEAAEACVRGRCEFALPDALSDGDFRWYVGGYSYATDETLWSNYAGFVLDSATNIFPNPDNAPGPLPVLGPKDVNETAAVTFGWRPGPANIDAYQLRIEQGGQAVYEEWSSRGEICEASMCQQVLSLDKGEYTWRVRGSNESGAGEWSAELAFLQYPLDFIEVPAGFRVHIYAPDVPNARALSRAPDGTVFVGSREGWVHALQDTDFDYRVDEVKVIASGLDVPTGLVYHQGDLYVLERTRLLRYADILNHLDAPPAPSVIITKHGGHGTHYLAVGPDGKLYFPVGAPCNICLPTSETQRLYRVNTDGTGLEVVAEGIRSVVGFDWHPRTHQLWFTENGRDWLGDFFPPDELNRVTAPGQQHFGYPYCHGSTVIDPEFGYAGACDEFTPPARDLGPHVAPLGMAFYVGDMFPAEYEWQVFIAEHGSWNKSEKIGYRVTLVRLDGLGNATSYEEFASGWLRPDEAVWGRPADVMVLPDGSLLVSDDYAGAIYRIVYGE